MSKRACECPGELWSDCACLTCGGFNEHVLAREAQERERDEVAERRSRMFLALPKSWPCPEGGCALCEAEGDGRWHQVLRTEAQREVSPSLFLRGCPFCARADVFPDRGARGWRIVCFCGAMGPIYECEHREAATYPAEHAGAAELWNQRKGREL